MEIILIPAVDTLIGLLLRRNPFIVRNAIWLFDLILLSFSKRRRTVLQIFIEQYQYHINSIALFTNFENRWKRSNYKKRGLRAVALGEVRSKKI